MNARGVNLRQILIRIWKGRAKQRLFSPTKQSRNQESFAVQTRRVPLNVPEADMVFVVNEHVNYHATIL